MPAAWRWAGGGEAPGWPLCHPPLSVVLHSPPPLSADAHTRYAGCTVTMGRTCVHGMHPPSMPAAAFLAAFLATPVASFVIDFSCTLSAVTLQDLLLPVIRHIVRVVKRCA